MMVLNFFIIWWLLVAAVFFVFVYNAGRLNKKYDKDSEEMYRGLLGAQNHSDNVRPITRTVPRRSRLHRPKSKRT